MDNNTRLIIFRAQTRNRRQLDSARKHIKRNINRALRKDRLGVAHLYTQVLVLIYCAWIEASFSKLIHTPYGFTLIEIEQIKNEYRHNNLEAGWVKCLELGLRRISSSPKSSYVQNINQKLKSIMDEYIIEPSQLRNKVAHGQWETALNRHNTAINNVITDEIRLVDVVKVEKWFTVSSYLLEIIEALIESPNKSFQRDYLIILTKLEVFLERSGSWSLEEKIKLLKKKKINEKSS